MSHEPSVHGRLKDIEEDAHHKETEIDGVRRYPAVAIREAFSAARRRLEDFAREQRGDVRMHDVPAHDEVVALSAADGDGFIQAGEEPDLLQPSERTR